MKKLTIIIIAAFTLMGCTSKSKHPETEGTTSIVIVDEISPIKDFLNTKLKGKKVTDVEIVSRDSVLSFAPMTVMYTECAKNKAEGTFPGDALAKLSDYFYHVTVVRTAMRLQSERTEDLTGQHQGDWRRLLNVKATLDDGSVMNDVEVIFDNDGVTPYMTGQDYDFEVSAWDLKINTL